jgi:poly(3-hydroxybutyrate) depolymerase
LGVVAGVLALSLLPACGAGSGEGGENEENLGSVSQAQTTAYQAESAVLSGATVSSAHAGFSGPGFVDYVNNNNDYIEWTVNTPVAGAHTLAFRHANGGGSSRPLAIRVNGVVANASLAFPSTGAWTNWATVSTTVTLNAGTNTIRATVTGSSGSNIDRLDVTDIPNPVIAVKPTAGCGIAPSQALGTFVKYTMSTSGTKDTNCTARLADGTKKCGAWSVDRDYYVWLPTGYDRNKPYPIVFQMGGCGSNGTNVYTLNNGVAAGVGNSVIRIGLSPPPVSIGHGTNPGEGCFDDKEGDDSVEFVFYQKLRDTLKTQYCYDENRVFASGYSSGSWMANELACKYSGNSQGYAIRGIAATAGGLPSEPAFRPTCSNGPMSGMWIHERGDQVNPFAGTVQAISRALAVNGCSTTTFSDLTYTNYPIGGSNSDSTCRSINGCPALYPLVLCDLSGNGHSDNSQIANPGFSTYFSKFSAAPLK